MNVFEAVKQSVTTRQAAEHYGIHVGRNGMACCPFHHDKTPSMKLDRRYHCFGCGADGDVIDFVAALYGLGKKEAAVQLANDFGLSYEDWKPPGKVKKPKPRQKSPEEQFQEAKNRCFRILADYLHLLRVWRKEYAPHSPEEAFHPRFVEALQKQAHVEYQLDVLLFGETEEKAALITDYGKDVIQIEQRMAELAAADAARTKKHHERYIQAKLAVGKGPGYERWAKVFNIKQMAAALAYIQDNAEIDGVDIGIRFQHLKQHLIPDTAGGSVAVTAPIFLVQRNKGPHI